MTLEYTITEIENGTARVEYGDGSWAKIALRADMTPEQVDDLAYQFGPKPTAAPDFLKAGERRSAQPIPQPEPKPFDGAAHVATLDPGEHARRERNMRLEATDHHALTDRTMPEAVATYRQSLRDLPETSDWHPYLEWDDLKGVVVLGVNWPTAPE